MAASHRYRGTEQEQVVAVKSEGHHLLKPVQAPDLVKMLVNGTPHVENLGGTGFFLPTGSSVGWDCEKIELRTVETSTIPAAVSEHLRLRNWVALRIQDVVSRKADLSSIETSCGGACYATGKTFGTHFNIEFRLEDRANAVSDLAALYVIGLPFHGNGALAFGTVNPCWSAHVEGRGIHSLFAFKEFRSGDKRRLQIATTAGCHRSEFSLCLAFSWHLLMAVAAENGFTHADIPRFEDLNAAAVSFNRDMSMSTTVKTSKGELTLLDCLDLVFPALCGFADTEDLVDACAVLEVAINALHSRPRSFIAAHDPYILETLFGELAADHGFSPERLRLVNKAIRALAQVVETDGAERHRVPEFLLQNFHRLQPNFSRRHDVALPWSVLDERTLEEVVALKAKGEEVYTRWSILGDGLFNHLESAGVVHNRVFDFIPAGDLACRTADIPLRGRKRGEFVKENGHCPDMYACSWEQLLDKQNGLLLEMPEPELIFGEWKRVTSQEAPRSPQDALRALFPFIERYLTERSERAPSIELDSLGLTERVKTTPGQRVSAGFGTSVRESGSVPTLEEHMRRWTLRLAR